jgi:pilus assembly protein Flp/PilA
MNARTIRNKSALRVRQRGQGMTEYIIITALIAIAAIAAVTYFGATARAQVGVMGNELAGQNSGTARNAVNNAGQSAGTEGAKTKNLKNYSNSTAQ